MESQATIALLVTGLALAVLANFGDRARRRAPLVWHAYLPWHGLAFAGVAAALFANAHLIGLARAGEIGF